MFMVRNTLLKNKNSGWIERRCASPLRSTWYSAILCRKKSNLIKFCFPLAAKSERHNPMEDVAATRLHAAIKADKMNKMWNELNQANVAVWAR